MSLTMFADNPAFSASFSCVKPRFSLCFLMFADRFFLRVSALSFIYKGYNNRQKKAYTPDVTETALDNTDIIYYILIRNDCRGNKDKGCDYLLNLNSKFRFLKKKESKA
jgi:hypothetical protein